jgi:group I intron endonuclease
MGTIYLLTNMANGKYYVGQTIQPPTKRFDAHCSKGSGCPLLSKAIAKHGSENFRMEVLAETSDQAELNRMETLWILLTNSISREVGYNIATDGRMGPWKKERSREPYMGRTLSAETRAKISATRIARKSPGRPFGSHFKHSEETKRKMSENGKGKKMPACHSAKTSARFRGTKRSPEVVARMAAAQAEKWRVHKERVAAGIEQPYPAPWNKRKLATPQ